jgi:predicted TIM-barrel fold metal-dependent hydrolase
MDINKSRATISQRDRLDDLLVVDVDVHLHEIPAEMARYCDMPWRKSLEFQSTIPERYLDSPGLSPGQDGQWAPFPGGHHATRTVTSARQMVDELAGISVDIGILFPDHLLKMALLPQIDYAVALMRAYNAWMVDQWTSREGRLKGCIVAAPQDPLAAAKEIERYAKEPSVVGVYLPTAAVSPLWGHRVYDPIYQAAQAADLPVLFHSVATIHPNFPHNTHGFETEMGQHTVGHAFSIIANLVDVVTAGVPVRFPDLRIAFTEAGLSWVPFIMHRLDKEYIERRREVPYLVQRPSYYVRKFYFATQPIEEPEDPHDLVTIIQLYQGENTTMFASDWPHHDFDHPRKVYQLPFSPEVRRKIMGENALGFFKLDLAGNRFNL